MLKRMTKRTFYCLILFILICGIGIYLFLFDMDRRSIKLSDKTISITLDNEEWTRDDVTLFVNYSKSNYHIKEYSYDGGKTWTTSNSILIDHNQKLDIVVKDINDKTYRVDYKVSNIDREGPVVLVNDNIQVSLNSKVDLKQFVTYYDDGSGLRDEVVITPKNIDTRKLGSYSFWVYTIDKLANKTVTKMNVEVVAKAPIVVAQSISLNNRNIAMAVDDEIVLIPNVLPQNTTDKRVTWISSDPDVATVDMGGQVKALKPGSATITAITSNDLKAICVVIVK